MFIKKNSYLRDISRIRVSEGRDLENGLRLDRNEKVDAWGSKFIKEIFDDKPNHFLSVYPESSSLYKKISIFDSIEESKILLTAGIDGGIKTIFEVATDPGDIVGVVSPTYAMYNVYSNLFQTKLFEIKYNEDYSFNDNLFEEFLNLNPTIFFLPNPNQPIESCFGIKRLRELAKRTLEKNCLFVIDEAYHLFGSETAVELINEFENVIVARTFSKGFGVPSIRLGYLLASDDNMSVLSKTRFAHESNALSNAVAEYLLDNYNIVKDYNEKVIESREFLKDKLEDLGINAIGDNGNYLLLDLGSKEKASALVEYLKDKVIYVKGPWKSPWEHCLTITIGPIETMKKFIVSVEEFYNQ